MNLVYLVFGNNPSIHSQANFSILSFLTQKEQLNKIIVVTDNAKYYNHIKEMDCMHLEVIDETILNNWKGEHNFFWRIKIKALEHISNHFPSKHMLYLDADTFLYNKLEEIKRELDSGKNVMHLNEGKLSEIKSKTTSKMWDQIKGNSYLGIQINKNHCMWNAGVVGISKQNFNAVIPQALTICDQMCKENVTDRLIEQFALSIALDEKDNLVASDKNIGHYWGNKQQWNQFINNCFLKFHFLNYSITQQIEFIKAINFSSLPIQVKVPNTRIRLTSIIAKLFPNKFEKYASSDK